METCRLHEWAYFLQAAGDLPDKAVLCPEDVDETVTNRNSMQLDDKELSYLQHYYKETVPLYMTACVQGMKKTRKKPKVNTD